MDCFIYLCKHELNLFYNYKRWSHVNPNIDNLLPSLILCEHFIIKTIFFRQYTIDYKLETYLKIARLYLEDDDPVQAEAYINRASLLQAESKNEQLQIYYKVCYARVLDYRRKFIEAAQRYNELSYRSIIHEDERMTALRNALICTVLASAGQQRSRMLATLFKDERYFSHIFKIVHSHLFFELSSFPMKI